MVQKSFYENHVTDYQKVTNLYFPKRHKKLIALIPRRKNMSILDVGCGTGVMLKRIKSRFPSAKLYGIDLSGPMISFAQSQYPDFELQVANAEKLPFGNDMFDVITSAISLHHYQKPLAAIEEAHRALKSNGQLLIMDITPKHNLARTLNDFGARHVIRDGHEAFQSLAGMENMFREASFKDIAQHFVGFPGVHITTGRKT